MQLDTGATYSIMNLDDFEENFPNAQLCKVKEGFHTYTGEKIECSGSYNVHINYNGQTVSDKLFIVDKGGPPLFGRTWLSKIKLPWHEIFNINYSTNNTCGNSKTHMQVDQLTEKNAELFSERVGLLLKGQKANLHMEVKAMPKFCKAREVHCALRPAGEKELDRLENEGIITPIKFSEWSTPIVPIVKPDKSIRLCRDYKVTVNQAIKPDKHPMPKIEDVFATLAGGEKFSKLDLKNAYVHLEMSDEAKCILTINTQKGSYQVNRLPYGITPATGIWQRVMEQVLQCIPGVACIRDDMILTGQNDEIHLQHLEQVLQRLKENGLILNKNKCQFLKSKVSFLGHVIDKHGLHKSLDKVDAVINAPAPTDTTMLRSFIGLLNYYHRFLPNLSSVLYPLHQLLPKGKQWERSSECENAFVKAKNMIAE
ncbi:uncharacterized protein K02A2.6-like [Anneissia japonica]|uniref:uncharacterized protein K02A2.6-like n=1 Tax=Anneissia japonica TaxID=1529436 RepID=UPI0014257223|nr:uncharacterized protein K02A2.6-like [Anneissia japonica]